MKIKQPNHQSHSRSSQF